MSEKKVRENLRIEGSKVERKKSGGGKENMTVNKERERERERE